MKSNISAAALANIRTAAALKAWGTIRANRDRAARAEFVRAAARRAAALKAWETIRENNRRAARRAAALKAWETIRAAA